MNIAFVMFLKFKLLIINNLCAMKKDDKKPTELKVLRVTADIHQIAKINAAKKGIKIQDYIQALIKADDKN